MESWATEPLRAVVVALIAAAVPLGLLLAVDYAWGPVADGWYYLEPLLAPPLLAVPASVRLGFTWSIVALAAVMSVVMSELLLFAVVIVLTGGGAG